MATEHDDAQAGADQSDATDGSSAPLSPEGRAGAPAPATPATGSPASAAPDEPQPAAPEAERAEHHDYAYGEQPPSGAAAAEEEPPTGVHTAMRGGTAPRALLREVPPGFPTPPPRPARPHRAPARPAEKAQRTGGGRRTAIIAGAALACLLLLAALVGGGALIIRSLGDRPQDPPTASQSTESPATGTVEVGKVRVSEASTELGVASVGDGTGRITAEGEFAIVTLEVANGTDGALIISRPFELELADGTVVQPQDDATRQHIADSESGGVIQAGRSEKIHVVYDVPPGSEPKAVRINLAAHKDAGTGTLALKG